MLFDKRKFFYFFQFLFLLNRNVIIIKRLFFVRFNNNKNLKKKLYTNLLRKGLEPLIREETRF